ncbi:ABC transporter permease [Mesorhizobium sp. J428]|uniref:ABC transporter permease n=1 Tax=Mesorhizobium sp. J428 TaxID=2898440 RepID=UPI00215094F6|nr:ABC transporter permease [Mesorhizobium sp. J428]MCR5858125.1 ABC transporter permease [Mesorhizobium sp. J428]
MSEQQLSSSGPWRRFRRSEIGRSLLASPSAMIAFALVVLVALAAALAPWIAPQDLRAAGSFDLMNGFTPPFSRNEFSDAFFLLGTDDQGRDMLSAMLFGARTSLVVGIAAVALSAFIGVTLGLIAGYAGGRTDALIMRMADVQLAIPSMLVALLIFGLTRSLLPTGMRDAMAIYVVILAIGLSDWVSYARTVRGAAMVEMRREYIQAATMMGRPASAILRRHLLPNVARPILVISTINFALAVIAESTLSFLGAGLPPNQPSLGTLIRIGQQFLLSGEWWILTFPALVLLVLALSINILGDWLRETLDPRRR